MKMKSFNMELTFLKKDDGTVQIINSIVVNPNLNPNMQELEEIFGEPKTIKIACGKFEKGWIFNGRAIIIKK